MSELRRDDPSARLEAAFTRIWRTRMAGLPFLNAALRVEALGFRDWRGEWLGAMVTPWFLNLVLTPGAGEWTPLAAGEERIVTLPAGRFRFICGLDEDAGEYHACSLFSPAQEFESHAVARAVALASLAELFRPGGDELRPHRVVSRRNFLRGRVLGQKP
jgi:[NiFe] hydrogenase assembly HybE family chaperone